MSKSSLITLYHATAADALDSIRSEGVRPFSYWTTNEDLAAYYQECLEDEGQHSVILALKVATPLEAPWAPDYPGLEEPITTVIGMSEEEVREEWDSLSKEEETAQACLDLIGSVRCEELITADRLLLLGMGVLGEETLEHLRPTSVSPIALVRKQEVAIETPSSPAGRKLPKNR
jgi:hypothetical protein